MPKKRMTQEEILVNESIENINRRLGSKISYDALYKKISKIMAKKGADREAALTAAYIGLSNDMSKNILPHAILSASNITFESTYMNTPAEKFSITLPSRESKILIDNICNIIEPGFKDKNVITEKQLVAIRDNELNIINSHTYYKDIDTCLKKWDNDCYNQDIEDFDAIFKSDYVYSDKRRSVLSTEAAKYYYKLKLTREKIRKLGFFGRLFNSKKAEMYKNYIEKTEANLARIGFDEAKHGEKAISGLKDILIDPFSIDLEVVKTTSKQMIMDYRKKHTEPVTEAHQRLEKAKALNANPSTSFDKKIAPILIKYGLENVNFHPKEEALNEAADTYDRTRYIDGYRDIATSVFDKALSTFYNQKINTWVDISVTTMLKDARAISVAALQHYAPMLEVKAFSELEKPMYAKLNSETIASRVSGYARRNKAPLSPEKVEAVKKEVADLVDGWAEDPRKIVNEDMELAREYAKQDVIKEPVFSDVEKELSNDRHSVKSVELAPIIEETEEKEEELSQPSI